VLDLGVLCSQDRFTIREGGERFVPLGREQEAFEIAPETGPLRALGEEGIEVLRVGFERRWSGWNRESCTHSCPPSPFYHTYCSHVNKLLIEREPLLVGFNHTRVGCPMRPRLNQRQVQRIVAQRAHESADRLRSDAKTMSSLE
jgi:hypothetical protein